MQVQSVQLRNFRNYVVEDWVPSPSINILIGKNGQGKSNLLESVYMLTHGASFRPGTTDRMIHQKSALPAVVKAQLQIKNLNFAVDIRLKEKAKSITVNQKKHSSAFLQKSFPVILFSPESLASIKEGPQQRRDLVDEALVTHYPANAQLRNDYKRALLQRNKLLRNYKEGLHSKQQTLDLLKSLDATFLLLATSLTWARIQAIKALQEEFTKSFSQITQKTVDISVDYLISSSQSLHWSEKQVYDALCSRGQQLQTSELESGVSLMGPHKHDIRFLFAGEDARYYCSQGQQRALILSFKLAQVNFHHSVHGHYPLLLLDDVLSELDQEKQMRFVTYLTSIPAQVILTTTDFTLPEEFSALREVAVFEINEGTLSEVPEVKVWPTINK